MNHYQEHNGGDPTQEEVKHWYEQQPPEALRRCVADAEHALQLFLDDGLQEILEQERKEAINGLLIQEIRMARRFWPQFGINVAGGLASAVLFAAILVVLALFVFGDISLVKWAASSAPDIVQESADGTETRQP